MKQSKPALRSLFFVFVIGPVAMALVLIGNQAIGQEKRALRADRPSIERSQLASDIEKSVGGQASEAQVKPKAWQILKPQANTLERNVTSVTQLVGEMEKMLDEENIFSRRDAKKWRQLLQGLGKKLRRVGVTVAEVRRMDKVKKRDRMRGNRIVATLQDHQSKVSAVNSDLKTLIGKTEKEMEEIRNKRQDYQTTFENFDQKANQLFNILSTVLKNIKEMESGVTRNIL